MAQCCADLLSGISDVLKSDPARTQNHAQALPHASNLVRELVLVHRTGHRGQRWRRIFVEHKLTAQPSRTAYERNAGYPLTVYCFLGYPAWPRGGVALLIDLARVNGERVRFSPFDSGGLAEGGKVLFQGQNPATLSELQRGAILAQHSGFGPDLHEYGASFLAAHLRDPLDYLRRGQISDPDFPPYHGVTSSNRDRRAWTIEVRLPTDVELAPQGEGIEILLERDDLVVELPPPYRNLATVVELEAAQGDFSSAIVNHMLRKLEHVTP